MNDAVQERSSAQVLQDVRALPVEGEGQVSSEKGATRVLGSIEAPQEVEPPWRVGPGLVLCSTCERTVPDAEMYWRTWKGRKLPNRCKDCNRASAKAWRQRHPDRSAESSRQSNRRRTDHAQRYRAMRTVLEGEVLHSVSPDVLRRLMLESPPPVDTEGERLAFYRGFLIGREKKEREEERFKEYHDLAYRIASELDRKYRGVPDRMSYEDLISHAYEAVLEIIRKKRAPERSEVAACIRNRIKDAYRVQFGREGCKTTEKRTVRGKQYVHVEDGEESWIAEGAAAPRADGSEELLEAVRLKAAQKFGSDHRFLEMLELRFQGLTYKEIGSRFGLTESRTCQLFTDQQAWMEEALLPLAAG